MESDHSKKLEKLPNSKLNPQGKYSTVNNPKKTKEQGSTKANGSGHVKSVGKPNGHQNTDTEAWSDDGRIHCVQMDDETIQCHDMTDKSKHKEDEILMDVDKARAKMARPSNTDKPRVTIIKTSEKNDAKTENKDEPIKDGTERAKFKTIEKDEKASLKLDWSQNGANPTVVNPRTGVRKEIHNLEDGEDIDIDSLIAKHFPDNQTDGEFEVRKQFKTVQEILDHLVSRNYPPLELDMKDQTTHTLWPDNQECRG